MMMSPQSRESPDTAKYQSTSGAAPASATSATAGFDTDRSAPPALGSGVVRISAQKKLTSRTFLDFITRYVRQTSVCRYTNTALRSPILHLEWRRQTEVV